MKKTIFALAAVLLCGLICGMFEDMHMFGAPRETAMDDYIIGRALTDRSAPNIVTAMVFDYRGFDTLGEAAVLFAALTSIAALFRDGGKRE